MSENGYEDPQGDEPTPEVYHRRRIIALIALLLVVLLLIWGIVSIFHAISGSSSKSNDTAAVSTSSSAAPFSDFSARASETPSADSSASENAENKDSAQASESASAQESTASAEESTASAEATDNSAEKSPEATETTAEQTPSPSETAATEAAVTTCNASDLAVSLTVDQNSYAAGQYPAMAITYTNTSGNPCTISGTAGNIDVNIISGPAQVYNYAQCNATATEDAELAAGASATKAISWDRSLNVLGCGTSAKIQPGYYWATATVNGVPSTATRIIVTG